MNLIRRFLAGYTDNFLLALMLWPLASLLLTLPILAWLYHRDGRLRFGSAVSTYLAVLYVLGLGCFTLYPLPSGDSGLGITYGVPWQLDPLAFVGDFAREGVSTLPQIAFNVVLFMPLGFIAGRFLRWGFWKSVIVGLLASLCIEAAQGTGLFGIYPYAFRTADVDDLIYNTSGAALGWACAAALASLDLFEEGAWREAVPRLEARMKAGLEPLRGVPGVADVRVLGAIGVVECERPVRAAELTEKFVRRGVWLRPFGRLIYMMPAFTTTEDELERLLSAVRAVVREGGFC